MHSKKGQTLIEVIIAISIISMVLLGFASRSLQNYLISRDSYNKIIATNLAREPIEIARNIRDSNWLKGCPDPSTTDCYYWNTGLYDKSTSNTKAYVSNNFPAIPGVGFVSLKFISKDSSNNYTFEGCIGNEQCRIYQNDDGFFGSSNIPNNPVATRFYRMIEIRPICRNVASGLEETCSGPGATTQIAVHLISEVRWLSQRAWRSVRIEDYLYNWR